MNRHCKEPPASRAPQHDVRRVHTGAVVTSLDMAGVSLTLMACDEQRIAALDAPVRGINPWHAFTPSSCLLTG
jgi:dihydroxyacetone kinase